MRSGARPQRPAHDPRRPHRAMPEWRLNPREPQDSPVKNCVLVPGARSLATTVAGANEPEYRMVIGEWRNLSTPAATCTGPDRRGRNEPPSTSTNAGKIAAPNQAPDGCTRYSECPPSFIDGDHLHSHSTRLYHNSLTVSSVSC